MIALAACVGSLASCGSDDGGTVGTGGGGGSQWDSGSHVCKPTTCASAHLNCGSAPDGCGAVITCGSCSGAQVCGAAGPNQCGTGTCTPRKCDTQGNLCGIVSDGCAATLTCGGCTAPKQCLQGTCTMPGTGGSSAGGSGGSAGVAGAGWGGWGGSEVEDASVDTSEDSPIPLYGPPPDDAAEDYDWPSGDTSEEYAPAYGPPPPDAEDPIDDSAVWYD